MWTVLVAPWRSLRDKRNFELLSPIRIAQFGEAPRKRKNNRLDATDTRREEVRINKQLHSCALTSQRAPSGARENREVQPMGRGQRAQLRITENWYSGFSIALFQKPGLRDRLK